MTSEPFAKSWSLLAPGSEAKLAEEAAAKGWHLFFIATQLKGVALGGAGSARVHGALRRILRRAKREDFNCVEVTQMKAKHFWGIPYMSIVAHSRHLQMGSTLEGEPERKISRKHARWAGDEAP